MLERFFAGLGPFDHLAMTVDDPLLNKQILELTDEEARSAFEVRPWGQFNAVRAAYPYSARRARHLGLGPCRAASEPRTRVYAGVLGGIEGMVKSFGRHSRNVARALPGIWSALCVAAARRP
jgi:hypothetical protein